MCRNDTHFQQRKSLQTYQGAATQNQKVKQRNRHIITKFLKPFFWHIDFEDVIEFLNDLGTERLVDFLTLISSIGSELEVYQLHELPTCTSICPSIVKVPAFSQCNNNLFGN